MSKLGKTIAEIDLCRKQAIRFLVPDIGNVEIFVELCPGKEADSESLSRKMRVKSKPSSRGSITVETDLTTDLSDDDKNHIILQEKLNKLSDQDLIRVINLCRIQYKFLVSEKLLKVNSNNKNKIIDELIDNFNCLTLKISYLDKAVEQFLNFQKNNKGNFTNIELSDEQKLYLSVERVLTKTNKVELQNILWACKPGNEIDYDRISKISDTKKVQKINELIQVYLLSAFRNLDELVNNIECAGIDIKSQIYRDRRG